MKKYIVKKPKDRNCVCAHVYTGLCPEINNLKKGIEFIDEPEEKYDALRTHIIVLQKCIDGGHNCETHKKLLEGAIQSLG